MLRVCSGETCRGVKWGWGLGIRKGVVEGIAIVHCRGESGCVSFMER